jgi:twitching motility two-component system response regulator PilG
MNQNREAKFVRPAKGVLNLLVKGFTLSERQLLEAVVKYSQRRELSLNNIGTSNGEHFADIVMIDTADSSAMSWARDQLWLKQKVVIWVDGPAMQGGFSVKRPIHWPALPMLLAQALETCSVKKDSVSVNMSRSNSVLIVDDSIAVRAQLRSLLERNGLTIFEAESGEAALEATANAAYACILMDVLMPGINGYEACRLIKANPYIGKKAKVVMLTSRTSPFDHIRGKMAGCDAYLTKPVDVKQLHDVISRYITKSSGNAFASTASSSLQYTI